MTSKAGTIFEDILDDALLGLAGAASIFVKNPTHQATAGAAITLLSQLVSAIDNQINGGSAVAVTPVSSTPAITTQTSTTSTT